MATVIEFLKNIHHRLNDTTGSSTLEDAISIAQHILKLNRATLFTQKEINLTSEQTIFLEEILDLYLNKNKPLQYILGFVPFGNLKINVVPPILIPRPETEHWVHYLIDKIKSLENQEINILDIGTGSGCIALSFANEFKKAKVWGLDISQQAIELAKKNAELNNITNCTFIISDLFENLPNIKFDLIVSNPPYIDELLFETLDLSVKNWEDKRALIESENGLRLIKKIIAQSKKYLTKNIEFTDKDIPQLAIEMDIDQANPISQCLKKNDFSNIKVMKDLSDRDRVIFAGR